MPIQHKQSGVDHAKMISIMTLYVTAGLISISGVAFSIFSLIKGISFTVMGTPVHGTVWGLVIAFLGVRYLVAVQKLKEDVYKSTSQFSLSHFKLKNPR